MRERERVNRGLSSNAPLISGRPITLHRHRDDAHHLSSAATGPSPSPPSPISTPHVTWLGFVSETIAGGGEPPDLFVLQMDTPLHQEDVLFETNPYEGRLTLVTSMSRLAGKPFVKILLHMPHSLTSSLFVRAGSSARSQVANLQPIRNSSNSKKEKIGGN